MRVIVGALSRMNGKKWLAGIVNKYVKQGRGKIHINRCFKRNFKDKVKK